MERLLESGETAERGARQRLLKAAAERFAEHGFAGTSVRDITRSAGCNIAAVNYYFGSKEELYTAVFEARFAELRDYRIGALRGIMQRADLTLELVLRTFATAFLEPLIEESRGRQTLQLFMRDLVSSRLPEGMMVEQMIKPTSVALLDALRRVCPDIDTKSAQLCMHSLVAQLIHILQAQRLMAHIHTPLKPELPDAVDHIIRFSAAGIRACANGGCS